MLLTGCCHLTVQDRFYIETSNEEIRESLEREIPYGSIFSEIVEFAKQKHPANIQNIEVIEYKEGRMLWDHEGRRVLMGKEVFITIWEIPEGICFLQTPITGIVARLFLDTEDRLMRMFVGEVYN